MKKLLLLITVLALQVKAQYPNFQWADKLNINTTIACAEDASGNVYVTGNFVNTVDFDPGPGTTTLISTGSVTGFLAKYSSTGTFIWVKAIITHTATAGNTASPILIKLDASNNVYIAGQVNSPGFDFDPGVGVVTPTATLATNSNPDAFIAKYDANGNYVWVQTIYTNTSPSTSELPWDIVIDNANNKVRLSVTVTNANVWTSGITYASTPATCNFIVPANTGGTYILSYNASTGTGIIPGGESALIGISNAALELDNSGNFYFAVDNKFEKRTSAGISVWQRTINTGTVTACKMALDASDNIFIYGSYIGLVDFDVSAGTSTLSSVSNSQDAYLLEYSNAGNFIWCGGYGNSGTDLVRFFSLDKTTGNMYLGSVIFNSGAVDVDFGPAVTTFTANGKWALLKYDSGKNFQWGTVYQGCASGDMIYHTNASASGNLYVSVNINCYDVDYSATTNTLTGKHFIKYSNCSTSPTQPTAIIGSNNVCSGSANASYSVSPVAGSTSYSWILPGGWSGTSTTNTIAATPGATGILSVTANNACGASAQQTLNVTVNPNPTISVNSGSICSGKSFTISPSGASTYTIQGGSTVVSPSSNTSYTVIGTSAAGCLSSNTATSNITVNASPTISVNNGSICSGNSFTISPSGANTYTIQGGSAVVSPTANASYTVVGTSTAGCVSASPATSNVTVNPLPTINASSTTSMLCVGQTATLTASGASTYTWNPGGAGTSIPVSPTVSTTYTIAGTSTAGCNNSTSFTQSVSTCAGLEALSWSEFSNMKLYPNPTNGKIYIESNLSDFRIDIINVLGQTIYSKVIESGNTTIDVSQLPNGLYFAKAGNHLIKFIKE